LRWQWMRHCDSKLRLLGAGVLHKEGWNSDCTHVIVSVLAKRPKKTEKMLGAHRVLSCIHTSQRAQPNVQYIYCVCMVILYIWLGFTMTPDT
jgi:hypothetical protein